MRLIVSPSLMTQVKEAVPCDADCFEFGDFIQASTFFCLCTMLKMREIVGSRNSHQKIETFRRWTIDAFTKAILEWLPEYHALDPEVHEEPDDWMYEELTKRFDEHVADQLTAIVSQKDCGIICCAIDLLRQYEREPEKPQLKLV